jgi:imidazolonepropionase-like amidohydrolase
MRALRAAQVYDGSTFIGPATVLVDGESIIGVERGHPDLPDETDVTSYDGTLLPGLIDSHVHLVSNGDVGSLERAGAATAEELDTSIATSLAAELAGGATTVQDLGDRDYRTLDWRSRPGLPRVLASGPPLTVPDGHCHYLGGGAEGAEGLRRAVVEHVERGVDVIKVMATGGMVTPGTDVYAPQLTDEELAACVAAGHAAGLRVLAHAHALSGIRLAVRVGVDGIEHFTCLTETGVVVPDGLLADVVSAGITVDQTLGIDPGQAPPPDKMPPGIKGVLERLGLDLETFRATRIRQAGQLREHGVRVVAGTDAGAAPTKRHGAVWRAVLEMVDAGYPVAEALATATSVAADELGLTDVTGRLRAGLAADLLVVDGDPTADISVLHGPERIEAVFRSGVVVAGRAKDRYQVGHDRR